MKARSARDNSPTNPKPTERAIDALMPTIAQTDTNKTREGCTMAETAIDMMSEEGKAGGVPLCAREGNP